MNVVPLGFVIVWPAQSRPPASEQQRLIWLSAKRAFFNMMPWTRRASNMAITARQARRPAEVREWEGIQDGALDGLCGSARG